WVVDRRQAGGEILANLGASTLKNLIVRRVFPLDQFFNDPEKTLAFGFNRLVGRKLQGITQGIVYELGKEDGPACRQWSSCPPEMQGGRMPTPDRLLAGGRSVDFLERDGDLDELLLRDVKRPGHRSACRSRSDGGSCASQLGQASLPGQPSCRRCGVSSTA